MTDGPEVLAGHLEDLVTWSEPAVLGCRSVWVHLVDEDGALWGRGEANVVASCQVKDLTSRLHYHVNWL